jgi:murein DD-endopeptidase MepM/ murein hydrolase activator NlpD
MSIVAFRSPVEVPLLRKGQRKPPGLPPAATFRVTTEFGDPEHGSPGVTHKGMDIGNLDCGAPIVAMAPGRALLVEDDAKKHGFKTNGLGVLIEHDVAGVTTEYWHFSKRLVGHKTRVKAGQRIGLVGDTGKADGCHCHIELKVNGRNRDPEPHAFGEPLDLNPSAPRGTKMPLQFKAADYRPLTNRKYTTDKNAKFREAPNLRAKVIKMFPGNVQVIPSGVVKGDAVAGGFPRTGLGATDWLEARMKVDNNIVLGYFHASVLTNQQKVE